MSEKLTKAQAETLRVLSKMATWTARGPDRAMCNKLVKMGLAAERFGYPTGFYITSVGRAALEKTP